MTESDQRLICFGRFELDLSSNELRDSGTPVKLQTQHFQLLALLVERAGKVVTREEIRQCLWGGETFVDFDRSINFCINQIRTALDDDPRNPRFIETLPRKGYRFIAPVTGTRSGHASGEKALQESVRPEPAAAKPFRRRWLLSVAAIAAAALLIASNIDGLRDRLLRPNLKPVQSLAVLPLENLSHDPEQEYFAEGMTDQLITTLAKISALRVVSRTSIIQYKGSKKPLPEIARELNVDAVVEGTVLRANNQVRITAQLVRASPEEHLWAEHYEGGIDQVLTLQDTVAQAVANSIRVKLTPQERTLLTTPRPVNADAYEAYLRGRIFSRLRTEERVKKSKEYFQQAVDKDPQFAPAWAGLANAYILLASFGVAPRAQAYASAATAAKKAMDLDGNLATAQLYLGSFKFLYEWDWAEAERLFKRAIDLDPSDGQAPYDYAMLLAAEGRSAESVAEARRAYEVEPSYPGWGISLGWFSYVAHEYGQAEGACRNLIEAIPDFSWGHICLGSVYLQTGRGQQDIPELRKALAIDHGVMELMYLGHDLAVLGDRTGAQRMLDELKELSVKRYVPPEHFAMVYEGMGDRERALQWFKKAYEDRSIHPWVYTDPRLDSIRSDPRFRDLMRRMGLPN